jgi:hypothetical protein
LGGGTSNVAGILDQIMTSIIKKDDVVWDNKLILAYGLTKIKGDEK